jgi:hypothetical protein
MVFVLRMLAKRQLGILQRNQDMYQCPFLIVFVNIGYKYSGNSVLTSPHNFEISVL